MNDAVETNTGHAGNSENSSKEDILSRLKNIPPEHIVAKEVEFGFKKTRDKDTNVEIPARPKLKLTIPYPTWNSIIDSILKEEETNLAVPEAEQKTPVKKYLLSLVHDDVTNAARQQVSDKERPVTSQDELKLDKLTLYSLATQPPGERRGLGISDETWADFSKAYVDIMTGLGKDADKAATAAKIFTAKLQPVRFKKPVLSFLKGELMKFIDALNEEQVEEFATINEYLLERCDTFLSMDDESLLAGL